MTFSSSYFLSYDFPKIIRDSGFTFSESLPSKAINWNDIRVVDINRVINEKDFQTIDSHIKEVLSCQLYNEFNTEILDSGFVKLFRLAQLSVEYLLECRRHLNTMTIALKSDLKDLNEVTTDLKAQIVTKDQEIKRLQKKNHKKSKAMKRCDPEGANMLTNLIMNNEKLNNVDVNDGSLNKCDFCDKFFISKTFLDSHLTRRHQNNLLVNSQVNNLKEGTLGENINEKLYLEFKELKDKLVAAEKNNALTNKVENNVETEEKSDEVKFKLILDSEMKFVKENLESNKSLLEELKKKQDDYQNNAEGLKKQINQNLDQLKNEIQEKIDAERHYDKEIQKIKSISETFEGKYDELKRFLEEKLAQNMKDFKTEPPKEVDLNIFNEKFDQIENKHMVAIKDVEIDIKRRLDEFRKDQLLFQAKIDGLNNDVKEQRRATEEQRQQINEIIINTNKIIAEMAKSQESKPAKVSETVVKVIRTQDPEMTTLKPEINVDVEKTKLHKTVNELKNHKRKNVKEKKSLKEILEYVSTSESDESSKISLRKKKPKTLKSPPQTPRRKINLKDAVKKDLDNILYKKLETFNIHRDTKSLSEKNLEKCLNDIKSRQINMGKKYKGYKKIKRNLLKTIEDNVDHGKEKSVLKEEDKSPNKQASLMGSILNKMKTKTANITKSKESLKSYIEDKISFEPKKSKTHEVKSASDNKKKLSARSILAMIENNREISKSEPELRETKAKRASIVINSPTSESSDDQNEFTPKNIIVTKAISHRPMNDIDHLLLSPVRKPMAANTEINVSPSHPGVLKTSSSTSSLTKKKVLFDLDANEMKSVSSDESSEYVTNRIQWDSSNSNINLKVSDDDYEFTKAEDKINNLLTTDNQIGANIRVSPKISAVASIIESKLASRGVIPPLGGIDTISTLKPTEKPATNDDVEISDWSIDELLK